MLGLFLLTLLALPFAEIYVAYLVGMEIGAINTLALIILMCFVGAAIAKSQGLQLARQSQAQLARGEVPVGAPLQGLLIVIGGVLLVIPGFITDVIGLLFVLPGTRHIIAFGMQKWLARQLKLGRIRFFGAGAPGGFKQGPFGQGPFSQSSEQSYERDVTPQVIDVTPISSSKTEGGNDDQT